MNRQNILNLTGLFSNLRKCLTFCALLFVSFNSFAQMKWTVDKNLFSNSMTLTAVVVNDNIEMRSEQIEIGAFSGNVCRGSVLLRYEASLDRYIGYLMIYGEGNESVSLKVFHHTASREYVANNTPLSFTADAVYGNPLNPYFIYLGTSLPEVSEVTVSPAAPSVQKGMSQQFTATVVAAYGMSTDVTWNVSGNLSTGTAITASGGLLTVSADETATSLTVTATSGFDNTKFGTATVTVSDVPVTPAVIDVKIAPATVSVKKGKTQQFTADVTTQGGASIEMTWSISGHALTATSISASGLLSVAESEMADTIIVTATSDFDKTKFGTATVALNSLTNAEMPTITAYLQSAAYVQNATATPLSVTASVTDDGVLSYQWYSNTTNNVGDTIPVSGATNNTCLPSTATVGTVYYYVVVKNTNDSATGAKTATAISNAAVLVYEDPTGTETPPDVEVNFYPNPFNDRIRLIGTEGCLLRIISLLGATVHVQTIATADEIIRLERLPAGIYFFRLEKDGKVRTVKAIKK